MSAAGAPPPPPPPPHMHSSIDDLPAELLLIIYEFTGLEDFLNLALAIYPILQRHGILPEITAETVNRIRNEWGRPHHITLPANPVSRMPVELWLEIVRYLEPSDIFNLVFALGTRFYRFGDEPSQDTIDRLRLWCQRSKKK